MPLYDLTDFPDDALITAREALELLKDIGFKTRDLFEVEGQIAEEVDKRHKKDTHHILLVLEYSSGGGMGQNAAIEEGVEHIFDAICPFSEEINNPCKDCDLGTPDLCESKVFRVLKPRT